MKKYHQQGAKLKDSNLGIDFFGKNKNYDLLSNGYLEFDITL